MVQQSTYIWKHATEVVQGISRNIVSSSVAVLLGSCTSSEMLPYQQLNTDMQPEIQNIPLRYQSVHEILSGKSSAIEEDSLSGLFRSMEQSEEFVDDNGNIFTREQLEASDE